MSCRFLEVRTSTSPTPATTDFIYRDVLFRIQSALSLDICQGTLLKLPRSGHLDHPPPVAHHPGHSFHIHGGETNTLFVDVKVLIPNSSLVAGFAGSWSHSTNESLAHGNTLGLDCSKSPLCNPENKSWTQFSLNCNPAHAVTPRRYVCVGLRISSPGCRVAGFQVE